MTFIQFRLLIPRAQLLHVITAGIFLAQRCKKEGNLHLYYLPSKGRGFFAEVGVDKVTRETAVISSFVSGVLLEEYTQEVRLPEE